MNRWLFKIPLFGTLINFALSCSTACELYSTISLHLHFLFSLLHTFAYFSLLPSISLELRSWILYGNVTTGGLVEAILIPGCLLQVPLSYMYLVSRNPPCGENTTQKTLRNKNFHDTKNWDQSENEEKTRQLHFYEKHSFMALKSSDSVLLQA